jgi:predicted transcriptional regulator
MSKEQDLLLSEMMDSLLYDEYFRRLVLAKDNVLDIISENRSASLERVIQMNELLNEIIRMIQDLEENYSRLRSIVKDRDDRLQALLSKIQMLEDEFFEKIG